MLPSLILSPKGDVLESHRFISSDGLDWIVEGRILGSEGLVLPVLRNIGYVLSSRLDWILGGHGLVFAVINMVGLFLQGMSLILVLGHLKIGPKRQTIGLIIYFGSWIHFSSLYILPDSFAVGCLVFGTTLFAVHKEIDIQKMSISLPVLLIGSLFQFYVFAGFMFSIILLIYRKDNYIARIAKLTVIVSLMSISIGITILWRKVIPHSSVPSQFDLLAISFKMLPFYIEIWASAFIVFLFLMIGFSTKKSLRQSLNVHLIRFFILFSLIFLLLALFYQWPDARIAYSGISFSLISLTAIFLSSLTPQHSAPKSEKRGEGINSRAIVSITIIFSLFLAPSDYWSPKFFNTRPLHTWSLIQIRDTLRSEPSNYNAISVSIKESCIAPNKTDEILDSIEMSIYSPYEKVVLASYARYIDCDRI
jgi:hypothetical protein